MVEICCQPDSKIGEACRVSDIRYAGVTSKMEDSSVFLRLKRWIQDQNSLGKWVHVHVSTPCITGSPLRNFLGKSIEPTDDDLVWPSIMSKAGDYLILGNSSSFELPRFNTIWGWDLTISALESLPYDCVAHLCATQG